MFMWLLGVGIVLPVVFTVVLKLKDFWRSQSHCKSGNISDTVREGDVVVNADHLQEMIHCLPNCATSFSDDLGWPSRSLTDR